MDTNKKPNKNIKELCSSESDNDMQENNQDCLMDEEELIIIQVNDEVSLCEIIQEQLTANISPYNVGFLFLAPFHTKKVPHTFIHRDHPVDLIQVLFWYKMGLMKSRNKEKL